jgi:short-subunit dehydrogenase
MPMKSFLGCSALITGASAGLGAEFARQLAPEAAQLVLVARRTERLEALRDELRSQHPGLLVEIRRTDLTRPEEVGALADFLKGAGISINFLINNAGLGDFGLFESADWKKIQDMLRVNMEALTAATHVFLPGMIERRDGAILNVSSTAGILPLPSFAVYAATKAYVSSFSEALHAELKGTGVTVTALCPGPVSTEFGDVASRPDARRAFAPPTLFYVPAEQVVREALQAVRRSRPRIIPGLFVKLGILPMGMLPWGLLRLGLAIGAGRIAKEDRKRQQLRKAGGDHPPER